MHFIVYLLVVVDGGEKMRLALILNMDFMWMDSDGVEYEHADCLLQLCMGGRMDRLMIK